MPRVAGNKGGIDHLFENNKAWVDTILKRDPEYFSRWAESQKPQYFWLGCADSRVVAEACTGLNVGDLFVHRNVGNVLSHSDTNASSALEYSVKVLGVKHVLVCGHTNCGAVKAALTLPSRNSMITNCWISQIRTTRNEHAHELASLDSAAQVQRLVELNVSKQVFNVCTSPVIQNAWATEQEVYVHGLVYDVATGALRRLVGPISGNDDVPEDNDAVEDWANVAGGSLANLSSALAALTPPEGGAAAAALSRAASAAGGADAEAEAGADGRRSAGGATALKYLANGIVKAGMSDERRLTADLSSHMAFEQNSA